MSSLHQHSPTAADKDARLAQLTAWLASLDLVDVGSLRPASSDASFRRYFRLDVVPALRAKLGDTLVAMDAPPERENVPAFIHVDGLLFDAGVTVPAIVARKVEDGFLLLSDLGTTTYLQRLDADNALLHVLGRGRRADQVPAAAASPACCRNSTAPSCCAK